MTGVSQKLFQYVITNHPSLGYGKVESPVTPTSEPYWNTGKEVIGLSRIGGVGSALGYGNYWCVLWITNERYSSSWHGGSVVLPPEAHIQTKGLSNKEF